MTSCRQFERKGLLQAERGLAEDPHYDSCGDCRAAREAHRSLQQAVRRAGEQYQPPDGWQDRVLAAIDHQKSHQRRRLWRPGLLLPVAAGAAALVALLVLALPRPAMNPDSVDLEFSVRRAETTRLRGPQIHPGDMLILKADTGGARYAELRIYLNDAELNLRCSRRAPCRRSGDVLTAQMQLQSVGAYQVLLLASDDPLPRAASSPDEDATRALDAGAQVQLREIRVW